MLGIIGGTGLYDYSGESANVEEKCLETPFGEHSKGLKVVETADAKFAFIPRHGSDHSVLPSQVNYRANIWALKKLGVKVLVSVSAVGSLVEELRPGVIATVNQYIDMTKGIRAHTFFGNGLRAHISTADPVSRYVTKLVAGLADGIGQPLQSAETYVCVEGPRLGTRAESQFFRKIGGSVVGMTNCPEIFLAKEAQISFVPIVVVTDYDSWKPNQIGDVKSIIAQYKASLGRVVNIIDVVTKKFGKGENKIFADVDESCPNRRSLDSALLGEPTSKECIELLEVLRK